MLARAAGRLNMGLRFVSCICLLAGPASRQALCSALRDRLEEVVCRNEDVPSVLMEASSDLINNPSLKVRLALSFPEFVRQGDKKLLKGDGRCAPVPVRATEAGDFRRHVVREEKCLTGGLMPAPRPAEFVGVQNLACVVKDRGHARQLGVHGHGHGVESSNESAEGLPDELRVKTKALGRPNLLEERKRVCLSHRAASP